MYLSLVRFGVKLFFDEILGDNTMRVIAEKDDLEVEYSITVEEAKQIISHLQNSFKLIQTTSHQTFSPKDHSSFQEKLQDRQK